ncbi:MAG: hypothetical protein R2733_26795 [Acidimicrobiales bacterium]
MSDEPAATTGTVVYLLGAQHSGSTIIETMLASSPDVFGLGQVGHFYTYTDFETCECGQRAAGCEPCRSIVEHVIEPAGVDRCRRLMKGHSP